MKLKRSGKFFINGITMTAAALLMRSVALLFNSFVAKTIGAEAVGLYSLLSGVYGFAVTLALSGINLAVTRLVSEYLAVDDTLSAALTLKKSFRFAIFFGCLSSVMLYFLSDIAASAWLHELRVMRPLKILCITLPAAAISSVINGYFTAVRRVYKNAVSQSSEMAIKIFSTVMLFSFAAHSDAEIACILLALGGVIAEGLVMILNVIIYLIDKRINLISPATANLKSKKLINRRILGISMPIALTSYFRSALISVEHSLIPRGLLKHGADKSRALIEYGTIGSMALTVINFPYALIGSFSAILIPEITESRARGKTRHVRYLSFRSLQSVAVFSFFLMGVFFSFSDILGELLYSSELAGMYIRQLSFLAPIMYTDTVTDSILKGMGEQLYSMKVNIADAIISVTLVWLLVPRYGIMGYIFTIYIAETINTALSLFKAVKVCHIDRSVALVYVKALFSSFGALAIVRLITGLCNISSLPLLALYAIIYFTLIRITDAVRKDDLKWLRNILRHSAM